MFSRLNIMKKYIKKLLRKLGKRLLGPNSKLGNLLFYILVLAYAVAFFGEVKSDADKE